MTEDKKIQNEQDETVEDIESSEEKKKRKYIAGFGILILVLAVILLSGCVIYSYNFNKKMAEKTVKVQNEYKKLREQVIADTRENEESAPENETDKKIDQDMDQDTTLAAEAMPETNDKTENSSDSQSNDKVIQSPDDPEQDVTYENYIDGKKFSFNYPSAWDGKVIFSNETKEDGSVVITCYHSEQYLAYQKGALESGEIFHILVIKDPSYQSENNNQYKMSEKDGYCGYYEEPLGVSYDYINHPEYAEVYKMVYDSQGKILRSFLFH